jgi:NAD(P)-dependent dehydrogenase (short-subunit alcohol dehydrogenase family)
VFAAAGARVVVPVRSPERARGAIAEIAGDVTIASLDLLDPGSIERFAQTFLATEQPLQMLVLSAGVMASPLVRDARGFEQQFAANHLGHFHLTQLLWPALLRAADSRAQAARVVSVSSRGHSIAPVNFDDPNFLRRPYDPWQAYGQSKTANVQFAVGLDARGLGCNVRAFALHPGTILTNLARHLSSDELLAHGVPRGSSPGFVPKGLAAGQGGDFKTLAQGAATSVWCAVSPQLEGRGGLYCEDVDIARIADADEAPGAPGVRSWAIDRASAERLWSISEDMTGARMIGESAS